jgi:hypothetical protein
VRAGTFEAPDHAVKSLARNVAMALGHQVDAQTKLVDVDKAGPHCTFDELEAMLTAGCELREDEVVDLEAPCDHRRVPRPNGREIQTDQAFLPAGRPGSRARIPRVAR